MRKTLMKKKVIAIKNSLNTIQSKIRFNIYQTSKILISGEYQSRIFSNNWIMWAFQFD